MTSDDIAINSNNFSVDKYGNVVMRNASILGGNINMEGNQSTPTITIHESTTDELEMYASNFNMRYYYPASDSIVGQYLQKGGYYVENEGTGQSTTVWYDGIITPTLTQTSKESVKKNISKYNENALETVLNSDIYTYNFKSENDTDKKHIGFVIGDEGGEYITPDEVISNSGEGIDTYSMISILWKAVQEQQEQIQQLQDKIKEGEN